MQKNPPKATGSNQKQKDFDSAFDKFAKKLTPDYKNQFKKVEYAGPKTQAEKIKQAQRMGQRVEVVNKGTGNKKLIANVGHLLEEGVDAGMDNPRELAIQVAQLRAEKKLTQDQLATKISKPASVIKDIENSTGKFDPQVVLDIERVLGVKIDRSWKK